METKANFLDDYRHHIAALTEDDIAVFEQVGEVPQDMNIECLSYVCILCLHGEASCRVGDREVEIKRGNIFFGYPNQFLEKTRASLDFDFRGILMSPAYFESILLLGGISNGRYVLQENPVLHINDQEIDLFVSDYDFLKRKLHCERKPHHKESVKLLLQGLVYEFFDCIEDQLKAIPYSYTSSEMLFQRFMTMAIDHTPREREVRYYADQLCITPKYLSVICKQQSGQTASTIINNLTIEYIKRTLRSTNKSVKEIAHEAGFLNLSFFGKYVRRELGMSPREYRMRK